MVSILFVCTGNTCRSAMAAPLLRKILNKELGEETVKKYVEITSAGVNALEGAPASREAIEVMSKEGIDLFNHRSHRLEKAEIVRADLIFTMTSGHKDMILRLAPEAKEKVYTLLEYKNKDQGDIMDPFGQGVEVYKQCAEGLREALTDIVPKLITQLNLDQIREDKTRMKIAISSDHAGYELKNEIIKYLKERGVGYRDFGVNSPESVDYPDQAFLVASAVASGEFEQGIVICGTGIGISISANKVKGIRAALCGDVFSARMARAHNDANILALGARVVGVGLALAIVEAYLGESFVGGRHRERVDKMMALENDKI